MDAHAVSAGDRAYQLLRDGILDGTYSAGTMLGEASLAAVMGLSRTPIRSALVRLQDEGWILVYPKRGALVLGLSDRAIADLFDVRLVLESAGIERASAETRSTLATRLTESIEVQREAFRAQDVRAFIESTIEFHRSFVEAAQNSVLLELNDRLADRQRFLLFSYGGHLLARCGEIISEHETLVRQLADGDAGAFRAALRAHLSDTFSTAPHRDPVEQMGFI